MAIYNPSSRNLLYIPNYCVLFFDLTVLNPPKNSRHSHTSIAVLPFINLSSDASNEYFSDGITEEIINALTRVQGLKVIARTSSFAFKGKNMDIRTIGEQLDVTTVLEGSVRKANNRVRVTAQLINTEDGTHYWSRNFDRELDDIFLLQDEISLLIANQIRENFGHLNIQDHLVNASTQNIKAYEFFLKGRFYQLKWDAESIKKAIEFYNTAVQIDPRFARAYYGNLQCYGLLAAWGYMPAEEGFLKARANFEKASEIDTSLPEYSQSIVGRLFWGEWNFQLAYEQIKKTLETFPSYTDALEAMAELFIAHGYFDEAIVYIQKAMEVDPISANHYYTLANIHYMQKDFEKSLRMLEKSLEINPEFGLAKELQLMCLIWLNHKEAFEKTLGHPDSGKLQHMLFELINGERKSIPESLVTSWATIAEDQNQLVPYELYILANSGNAEEAIRILEMYIAAKRGQIINFRQEPFLTPLRNHEKFQHLHISNFSGPERPQKQEKSSDLNDAELEIQKHQLLDFIAKEKPYLDSQLNLSSLAQAFSMHPNKLSFLINEKFKQNFNEFTNQFRLKHFKEIALDRAHQHLSILGLAYESGFNSKTVFNTYFKKVEGITPGQWVENAQKQ